MIRVHERLSFLDCAVYVERGLCYSCEKLHRFLVILLVICYYLVYNAQA